MRLEIGAGEYPDPAYDVHADLLRLPGIELVCAMDRLPLRDSCVSALRACDVLEHQSWELVPATLAEWGRVLARGATVYIRVPDARFITSQWLAGELVTERANYWLLGGHSERPAHRGVDDGGVARWLYNAHHAMFDAQWLTELLEEAGFDDVAMTERVGTNLECTCRYGSSEACERDHLGRAGDG